MYSDSLVQFLKILGLFSVDTDSQEKIWSLRFYSYPYIIKWGRLTFERLHNEEFYKDEK